MKTKRREPSPIQLNMTSMMDIVFQLIIFFILVTNFTTAELPELVPPAPEEPQAEITGKRKRIVVNIVPPRKQSDTSKFDESGDVGELRVGISRIKTNEYEKLTALIEKEKKFADDEGKKLEVDLRSDFRIHYVNVQPVMKAIVQAGVSKINVITLMEKRN